jgi:very-short-patch-repair endonuclease
MFKISKQILELEDATKEQFAAYLKANQTTAEKKFWERVKDGQIPCLEFEQQKIISGWIVDFYLPSAKLIIEIDGSSHNTKEARELDALKDGQRQKVGYAVLRFSNFEVKHFLEICIARVCQVAYLTLTGNDKAELKSYMKANNFPESEDVLFQLRMQVNGNGQIKVNNVRVSQRQALKNLLTNRTKSLQSSRRPWNFMKLK